MSATAALARGRILALALMVDTCTVQHRTGQTTDDLTGVVTPTYATVYAGACKFQTVGAGSMGRRFEVGEIPVVVLRLELHLPVVGSESVGRADLVTALSSVHDAALVGRTFRVHDLAHKSFPTARRLVLEEAT